MFLFFPVTDIQIYKIEQKLSEGKAEIFNNTNAKIPKLSLRVMIETCLSCQPVFLLLYEFLDCHETTGVITLSLIFLNILSKRTWLQIW